MPPIPVLPDEILEETFLRLPPDEPACLVRVSLASKLWRSLLSSASFHRRYCEFHGAPPMLGFAYTLEGYPGSGPLFVSNMKFGAHVPKDEKFDVFDCRHGLLLLGDKGVTPKTLVLCNPMTGYCRELYTPKDRYYDSHVAAVLCAMTGCDHRTCHQGPFFVSLDESDDGFIAHAHVSLLQMGEWSEPCSQLDEWSKPCSHLYLPEDAFIELMPPVLVEDALYIMLTYEDDDHIGILKYDLGSECLSLIDAPLADTGIALEVILISMEDASLGYAHLNGVTLSLWSRNVGSEGVASWTHRIVINLKNLLPIRYHSYRLRLNGSVEGRDIIFVTTDLGIYEINLKSLQWKNIWNVENCRVLFPYKRFYARTEHNTKRNKTEDGLVVEQLSLTITDSRQSEINHTKHAAIPPQSHRKHAGFFLSPLIGCILSWLMIVLNLAII